MEQRIISFALRYRLVLFLISIVLVAACAVGLQYFKVDGSPRVFMDENNQGYKHLQAMESEFGRINNAIILIAPKPELEQTVGEGFMFEPNQLKALSAFTEAAWLVPYAVRVESIINYQHSYSDEDGLYVESLLEEYQQIKPQQIDQAEAILRNEASVVDRLLSKDGNYAAIVMKFNMPDSDLEAGLESADAIEALAESIREQNPDLAVYPSGTLVNDAVTLQLALTDTAKVIAIMYAVMFILLATLLRSVLAMLCIFFVTVLSVTAGVGLASWFGVIFSSITMSSISIIITVTIAHCVHVFMNFFQYYRYGEEKMQALEHTLRVNLKPVFLTSLTTIVGFLSMNVSDLPPMRAMGNISAAGVLVVFLCTYTLLPAMMTVIPFNRKAKPEGEGFSKFMAKLASFVILRYRLLLILCIGFSAISVFLAFDNIINDNMGAAIHKPHQVRTNNDMVEEHLGGIFNFQYQLAAKPGSSITDTEYLQELSDFTDFLRDQPEVVNVFTFSDVIKKINDAMQNDYTIPSSKELAAQYLLLYELSIPAGLDLSNQVALDKNSTRLVVTFENMYTNDIQEFRQRIKDYQLQNMPQYMQTDATGFTSIWSDLTVATLKSSIKGAVIALLLISLVMMVVFRSVTLGLISFIPNLLPASFGFAFWRLYDGELNFGLMMVLSITIGIVVDDTVHFLSKYQRAYREGDGSVEGAIRSAFANVGPALFVTTMVLMTGFAIMMASKFLANSSQGVLICAVLFSALLLDFFMLPPLLMWFKKRK